MAVVQNSRVSRLNGYSSPRSRGSLLSDEDDLQTQRSVSVTDDDIEDDVDSGMEIDGVDLPALGDIGAEFCGADHGQCSIPFELYDLPDLSAVLSLETWNYCLTEEERFLLAEYLPDMDQETFNRTLMDLFSGSNFHFGSPLTELFDRLKGGLLEPRVALYRQGFDFFQKRKHYHNLCDYQNSLVGRLIQMRAAWENCAGYSIEEKLRVLNIFRSKKGLLSGEEENSESVNGSASSEEFIERIWNERFMDNNDHWRIHHPVYKVKLSEDVSTLGENISIGPVKCRKQNPKGVLKVIAQNAIPKDYFGAISHRPADKKFETKSRAGVPILPEFPLHAQATECDMRTTNGRRQLGSDCKEQQDNLKFVKKAVQVGFKKNRSIPRVDKSVRGNLLKARKKRNFLKKHDSNACANLNEDDDEKLFMLPMSAAKENQSFEKMEDRLKMVRKTTKGTSINYSYSSLEDGKKTKKPKKVYEELIKDEITTSQKQSQQLSKRSHFDQSAASASFQLFSKQEVLPMNHSTSLNGNEKSKKRKKGQFQDGKIRVELDPRDGAYKKLSQHVNYPSLQSDHRKNLSEEKLQGNFNHNTVSGMKDLRSSDMYSSERLDEGENIKREMRNSAYMHHLNEVYQPTSVRSVDNRKKLDKPVGNEREQGRVFKKSSKKMANHGKQLHKPELEMHNSKWDRVSKMDEPNYFRDLKRKRSEMNILASSLKPVEDSKKSIKPEKNSQMQGDVTSMSQISLRGKVSSNKKWKSKVDQEYPVPQANVEPDCLQVVLDEEASHEEAKMPSDSALASCKKFHATEAHSVYTDHQLLPGGNMVIEKHKGKVRLSIGEPNKFNDLRSVSHQLVNDSNFAKKRRMRHLETEKRISDALLVPERGILDIEPETMLRKKPFTLITPSIHTDFSFSIVHFLSAVRRAMITPDIEDTFDDIKHDVKKGEQNINLEDANNIPFHGKLDLFFLVNSEQKNLPSLSIQEIVDCVKMNPGDPCILETREPLQDLVRGVLKIFASKIAPLGVKGWKALVSFDKSTKSWSWIGPVSSTQLDLDRCEEETSPDAWGVPHKILVKMVDAFANWLKTDMETLQKIGSLPAPPMPLMLPSIDEKERFRDLRAQKSLTTISPSSEEVRAYFRHEEVLRYSVPDRAFSYTAADGKKSSVAPLRRCGGKPTSKARDHFMLKPDRPPHVTILCLVRDSASRLPGSIGTRADVCTLLRDSQYIVEDVSDAQVNQVVSGALDRLHYERDPCVLFDGERKLWVYQHRDREEEDFEDDGTSSTKKWRRPRKDGDIEPSEPGAINEVIYQGTCDQIACNSAPGYDVNHGLNAVSSCDYAEEKANMEENMDLLIDSGKDDLHNDHPMGWEILHINPLQENKMQCLKNSANEFLDG